MKRPTSVTVIAIVNIIFAAFGVLAFPVWLVTRLELIKIPGQENNPALQVMKDNAAYKLFNDLTMMLGIVASIVCLSAAIGLLKMRPWARLATIGWGIYATIMGILGVVVQHLLFTRPMLEQVTAQGGPTARTIMIVGLVVGSCFQLLFFGYLVFMIVLLNRPTVRAAFAEPVGPEAVP